MTGCQRNSRPSSNALKIFWWEFPRRVEAPKRVCATWIASQSCRPQLQHVTTVDQRLWKWLQFFKAGSIGHEESTLVGQSHGCGSGTKAQRGEKNTKHRSWAMLGTCLMLGYVGILHDSSLESWCTYKCYKCVDRIARILWIFMIPSAEKAVEVHLCQPHWRWRPWAFHSNPRCPHGHVGLPLQCHTADPYWRLAHSSYRAHFKHPVGYSQNMDAWTLYEYTHIRIYIYE